MKLEEFVKKIDEEAARYKTSVRQERASFLVWFLINYFRLDEDFAIDMICDRQNDKGIDGIYVDDQTEEAYIFQSKYSPNPGSQQGDVDLREFKGASAWFGSLDNVAHLDQSNASQDLKSLVTRLGIIEKVARGYKLYLVFVTNKRFNPDATDYLKVLGDDFEAWDIDQLFDQYTYSGKDKPVEGDFSFTVDTNNLINYQSYDDIKVSIFPAKALEIVELNGIQDRTLFAKNVRYGLGRTRVNKDITKTLSKNKEHQNFFLYHNGITLVCSDYKLNGNQLTVSNYSIVNGCQSTLSFYENKKHLSDDVKILMRVIQTGKNDRLSKDITYFTNNQNAISLKDLKSNDKIQQDLQDEFYQQFSGVLYKIKNGENESGYKQVINNDFAAQLITSFYLKEPYTVHQKTQIFTDNYMKIFNMHINASYIYLLNEMYRAIDSNSDRIEDDGIRSYKLTKFFFLYVFRLILESDSIGKELLSNPKEFEAKYKTTYFSAFSKLFNLLVLDFNYLVTVEKQKMGGYFDYKNALRNQNEVAKLSGEISVAYKRQLVRHPEDSFSELVRTN
jgi:predicted small secreted protein